MLGGPFADITVAASKSRRGSGLLANLKREFIVGSSRFRFAPAGSGTTDTNKVPRCQGTARHSFERKSLLLRLRFSDQVAVHVYIVEDGNAGKVGSDIDAFISYNKDLHDDICW